MNNNKLLHQSLTLLLRSPYTLPRLHSLSYSTNPQTPKPEDDEMEFISTTQIATPNKIQKLIATQKDPLLAKEIFDLASKQPNFRHSYATFHTLILKLAKSKHFTLMDSTLSLLKKHNYPTTPSLFSNLIRIFGDTHLPERAINVFYSVVEYNCRPTVKHLNLVLSVLVCHRSYLRPAYDLFRVAHKYGVEANVESYNILMKAFCFSGEISVGYKLFNEMCKRDVLPSVDSYRILMQALCRKSQVNKAVDLLDDMLNKGFVPDTLSYTTLLNSLCRKKQLREAYKLLCRMKVKGCNPNIVHYNTVILGLCREGKAVDAVKVLDDMYGNQCLPNLESYRTLVAGLVREGMFDEARKYMVEMMSKELSPHFAVAHGLIKGLCNVGRVEDACGVLEELLKHGEVPHVCTWEEIVPRVCDVEVMEKLLDEVIKVEITPHMRIIDAGAALEEYLIKKVKTRTRRS